MIRILLKLFLLFSIREILSCKLGNFCLKLTIDRLNASEKVDKECMKGSMVVFLVTMDSVALIPLDLRRKLQVLLLVRHGNLGRELSCLQDDFFVFFKERVEPSMYACKDWETLLKAVPEVVVKKTKKCRVAYGNPLTYDFAVELLSRTFPVSVQAETTIDTVEEARFDLDISVNAFLENLLEGDRFAPGENAPHEEVELRQDSVTPLCQEFSETFEMTPQSEVEASDSPSQAGQSIVAADCVSKFDERAVGVCDNFNKTTSQNTRLLDSSNQSFNEVGVVVFDALLKISSTNRCVDPDPVSNVASWPRERHKEGVIPDEYITESAGLTAFPAATVDKTESEVQTTFPAATVNEGTHDDDIQLIFDGHNTRTFAPSQIVNVESKLARPNEVITPIPTKCSFRALRDGFQAQRNINTESRNNRVSAKLKSNDADFMGQRKTVYTNALTSCERNQAEPYAGSSTNPESAPFPDLLAELPIIDLGDDNSNTDTIQTPLVPNNEFNDAPATSMIHNLLLSLSDSAIHGPLHSSELPVEKNSNCAETMNPRKRKRPRRTAPKNVTPFFSFTGAHAQKQPSPNMVPALPSTTQTLPHKRAK